jgi:hypothetical protein
MTFEQLLQRELTIAQHNMVVANLQQNNINNNITKFLQNVKILQNAEKRE